ncbi:MAG TPA: DUF4126 domain-containing protein [Vicinamibacteria bacterium]|nr:DUF4126 domain-containing protein [Vicinamibacteria bacterium]
MPTVSWTEVVSAVALAIGLAACAGLRAWLPLLLTGGLVRAGVLEVGSSFSFIASDRALILFGLASAIEIVADKVPAIDHALDAVGTVARPMAATVLAASVFGSFADPLTAVALGAALGAPTAMVPHVGKSVLRAASSALTAGVANPVISVLEDLVTLALFVLAVLVPLLAGGLVLLTAWLIARRLWRRTRRAPAPSTT